MTTAQRIADKFGNDPKRFVSVAGNSLETLCCCFRPEIDFPETGGVLYRFPDGSGIVTRSKGRDETAQHSWTIAPQEAPWP